MISNVKMPKEQNKLNRALMVIPTLGERLDLLKETLSSIESQNDEAYDIIVVCPVKSKDARSLAKDYGAKIADDPGSLTSAVNLGISLAKPHHEYVSWMGDDDLIRKDALINTAAQLRAHPEAVVAYGYCDYIDDSGTCLFTSKAGRLAPWIMTWGPDLVPLPGLLFRLSALKKVGKFDESLKYAMDLDMLLRLRKEGSFINTARTIGAFRWHPDSITVANRAASLDEAELVKRRHLPKLLRPLSPVWEKPVRIATHIAAKRVNTLARGAR